MLTRLKRWWSRKEPEIPLPEVIETVEDLVRVRLEYKKLEKLTFNTAWESTRLRSVQTHYTQLIRDLYRIGHHVKVGIGETRYTYYNVLLEDWFTDDESYPLDLNLVCAEIAQWLQQTINLCNAEVDKRHVENVLSYHSQSLSTVINLITVCYSKVSVD